MRCHDVQGHFSEIYDGIAVNQTILEKHLQECPTCAAEYEDYRRLIDELWQLPMPELPVDFHKTVMAKVREIAVLDDSRVAMPKPETKHLSMPVKLPQKSKTQKAYAAARRWASVAAAASILLVSLWAVRAFDLMPQPQADMNFEPTPMVAPRIEYYDGYAPQADNYMDYEFAADESVQHYIEISAAEFDLSINDEDFDTQDTNWVEPAPEAYVLIPIEPTVADLVNDPRTIFPDDMDILEPGRQGLLDDTVPVPLAWTIAFALGLAALGVSLVAILLSIKKTRKA